MKVYPTFFKVTYYDGDCNHGGGSEVGIMFASSYGDAASRIEEYYGADLVSIDHIEQYEECDLIAAPSGNKTGEAIKTLEEWMN